MADNPYEGDVGAGKAPALEDLYGEEEDVSDNEEEDTPGELATSAFEPESTSGIEKAVARGPSKQVEKMRPSSGKPTLPKNKDPFPIVGEWTPETFSQLEVIFPVFTPEDETTNDLTRAARPEARHWKAPIKFRFSSYTSQSIRVFNVPVPYHDGKDYGSSFIYVALPRFIGECFSSAGKTKRPTMVDEKNLVPDPGRWWKVLNNVGGSVGVIDKATRTFRAKSLNSVFSATGKGVTLNLDLTFKAKAATQNKEPLKPSTYYTVQVELVRGYIEGLGQDIEKPRRVTRAKRTADPLATSSDIATDDVLAELHRLGL